VQDAGDKAPNPESYLLAQEGAQLEGGQSVQAQSLTNEQPGFASPVEMGNPSPGRAVQAPLL